MKSKTLKTRRKYSVGYWTMLAVMTLGAITMIFPTVWMLLCSFKTQNEMYQMPPSFFPKQFNFDNFASVFKQMPFGRYYLNSVGTGLLNTLVGVITSSLLGYIFAKYEFPGRDTIFLVVLACMMIPYETLMPTVYKLQNGLDQYLSCIDGSLFLQYLRYFPDAAVLCGFAKRLPGGCGG